MAYGEPGAAEVFTWCRKRFFKRSCQRMGRKMFRARRKKRATGGARSDDMMRDEPRRVSDRRRWRVVGSVVASPPPRRRDDRDYGDPSGLGRRAGRNTHVRREAVLVLLAHGALDRGGAAARPHRGGRHHARGRGRRVGADRDTRARAAGRGGRAKGRGGPDEGGARHVASGSV
jgi:hypothetical protein